MAYEKSGPDRPNLKRRRSGPRKHSAPLYAAVDLGTNNCRLLIAARKGKGFSIIDSHSQIARLGEGLAATGRLSDDAIARAHDALGKIAAKIRAKKVGQVRCIATEACRRAENGPDFIREVHERTGLTFKVISAREEAQLALAGCHDLIAENARQVLVLDIGGGSTELSLVDTTPVHEKGLPALLDQPPIQAWTSLPIGVVTLTEAFAHLGEEEGGPAMLDHARAQLAGWKQLDAVKAAFSNGEAHVIGTSGTITCLTGVHLKLDRYRRDRVDGQWVNRDEMMQVIADMRTAGLEGRKKFPTIGEDRASLMLAGCAIVEAVWEQLPGARMRVADRGLREGLLLTMMQGPKRGKKRRRRRKRSGASPSARGPSNE